MQLFHQLEAAEQDSPAGKGRRFVGDGTPFLRVPGLKRLRGVTLGGVVLALSISEQYPMDASERPQYETVELPMFQLGRLSDGTTVLLRNIKSNDGVWQKGVEVWVDGTWDDDAAPEVDKEFAMTADISDLGVADLREIASVLGIDSDGVNKKDLAAAIEAKRAEENAGGEEPQP